MGVSSALASAGVEPGRARIARIRDTAHLDELTVSTALVADAQAAGWTITDEPRLMEFDDRDDFVS